MDRRFLQVKMTDGSLWNVSLRVIAEHRAERLFHEHSQRTSSSSTNPFRDRAIKEGLDKPGILVEWAEGEMDWDHVKDSATQVAPAMVVDYQFGWVNGEKRVVMA